MATYTFTPITYTGRNKKRTSLLWIYAITGFFSDIIAELFTHINIEKYNDLLFNIFYIIEFTLIIFYYKKKIFNNNTLFYIVLSALTIAYILITIRKSVFEFSNYGAALFDLASISLAIIGLYRILKDQKILFLGRSEFFWINVALLIYCSSNFVVFLIFNYVKHIDTDFKNNIWFFHNIMNIIFSMLVAKSLSAKEA